MRRKDVPKSRRQRFQERTRKQNTLTSSSTLIMINQMNDVILLDSSHACLGANVACSNDENLEVNAR